METTISRHDRRLAQIREWGVSDLYRCVRDEQVVTQAAEVVPPPPPLLATIRCKQEFIRRHDSIHGTLPSLGIYLFDTCFVGKNGTLIGPDRKVLWSDDLLSDYWMWFLGKILMRETADPPRSVRLPLSGFLTGGSGARDIDAGGAPVVTLVKPGVTVYGHWLLDTLPMIWHLRDAAERGLFDGWHAARFLVSSRTPEWAKAMIGLLFDIDRDRFIDFDDNAEVVRVRNLVVPGLLRVSPLISGAMNRFREYVIARTAPLVSADARLPRELFISRANFASDVNRLLLNWSEVRDAAEAQGLAIVTPEKLTWPEQVAMFAGARIVLGEYGSGLHNALFGASDCIPVVFATKKMNWSQSAISGLRGQRMIYVQPEMQEWRGVHSLAYRIDPNSVGQAVAAAREA